MPAQLALIACNWAAAASIAGFDKRESSYIEFKPEKRTHSDAAATKVRKNSTIHHKQTSSIGVHLMRDTKTSGGSRDDRPPPPPLLSEGLDPPMKTKHTRWIPDSTSGPRTEAWAGIPLLTPCSLRDTKTKHTRWTPFFFFITPLSMLGPDKTMMGA